MEEAAGGVAPSGAQQEDKACPDRHKWSIVVNAASAVSITVCVCGFGAHYGLEISGNVNSVLDSFNAACSIQAVFGIFVTVMLTQIIVLAISAIGICCKYRKDFYRLNMFGHLSCLIGTMIGCIIFGIKKKDEIFWFFWFAVIAVFIMGGNVTIWFSSQFMRRREKLMKIKLDAVSGAGAGGY